MSATQVEPSVEQGVQTDIVVREATSPAERVFALDQRRAKAYAESGYFTDAKKVAQALVKIELARELEIAAFEAMTEVHVIEGKPELGAGILARLVKRSGRYDYRLREHTNELAVIAFFDVRTGELLGESSFSIEDAIRAELASRPMWKKYPKNMLFARAMSNGVAWYCPDAVTVRLFVDTEIGGEPSPAALDGAVVAEEDETPLDPDEEQELPDPEEELPVDPLTPDVEYADEVDPDEVARLMAEDVVPGEVCPSCGATDPGGCRDPQDDPALKPTGCLR